jgi:phospholipid/cholesterol/gamma-HCH transport system ATP-binding protein
MLSMQKILALTILIITHDPMTLVTVCDRVAMIADKKLEVGTIDDLLKSSSPKTKEYLQGPRMQAALSKRKKGKA